MERGSDKHAPRIDDAIKQRTELIELGAAKESRSDEGRLEEGVSDGELAVDEGARVEQPSPGDVETSSGAAELRADLARHLDRAIFPAARDSLIEGAERRQASAEVVQLLRRLPHNHPYDSIEQVWLALGGRGEHRP